MSAPTVRLVDPGGPHYGQLVDELAADPLASQWWEDAESRIIGEPAASYMVAYVPDPDGRPTPAAWAGWREDVEDGAPVIVCCHNYVRRGYRGRSPELYQLAYLERHRRVLLQMRLPAYTYLYPEAVGVHLRDGWVRDIGPDASGTSQPYPGGPTHVWQRLRWTPPG